tara:strand:- start:182 stop:523 length:342 start_codon:yes stop_codon:yes gene_type:complete
MSKNKEINHFKELMEAFALLKEGNFNGFKVKIKKSKDFLVGLFVIILLVGYYYMPDENSSSDYTVCDCLNYVGDVNSSDFKPCERLLTRRYGVNPITTVGTIPQMEKDYRNCN